MQVLLPTIYCEAVKLVTDSRASVQKHRMVLWHACKAVLGSNAVWEVQVQFDPDVTGPRAVIEAIQDAGFDARIVDTDRYSSYDPHAVKLISRCTDIMQWVLYSGQCA